VAELAWTVATQHQHRGYAQEAAGAMVTWLRSRGVDRFVAHVHPEHRASIGVALTLGLTTSCMVNGGRSLTRSGRVRSLGGAGRESSGWAAELFRWEGSFLAGDRSGDRGQDGVQVLASAQVTGQSAPVLQVADAVLDANPLRGVGPTFGLVRRGEAGGTGSWFFRRAGRGVRTAPAVCALSP
jgi:hypothetical protein